MSITIYGSDHTTLKYTLNSVQSSNLHQSLNGECTFDLTMPGRLIPGIAVGDEIRLGNLYFTVASLTKSGQSTGVSFSANAEHISYALSDVQMPEGEYTGSPSSVLTTILSGSGLSVGVVDVSGSYTIQVGGNTSRRTALLQWATICGAEISYYQRTINLKSRVGSSTAVSLSGTENVKSLSVTLDSRGDTQSYSVELSRLQHLGLGDTVTISYSGLNLNVSTRVISLDYDPFHPMAVSMVCGDYVPTYYDAVNEAIDSVTFDSSEVAEAVSEALDADLVRAIQLNFTNWDNGVYQETLETNELVEYSVLFDQYGRPTQVSDGVHTCTITWGTYVP